MEIYVVMLMANKTLDKKSFKVITIKKKFANIIINKAFVVMEQGANIIILIVQQSFKFY